MGILNANFIITVTNNIDDCSNPIQLRSYLSKYKDYMFSSEIVEVFISRIEEMKTTFIEDQFNIDILRDLEEDMELELSIAKALKKEEFDQKYRKHPKVIKALANTVDISMFVPNSDLPCPFEKKVLLHLFNLTNGNKVDICRFLDISNSQLNSKIELYDLKQLLNNIRREYRASNPHLSE